MREMITQTRNIGMKKLCTNELSWRGNFIPVFFFFCYYCFYALRVFIVLIATLVSLFSISLFAIQK